MKKWNSISNSYYIAIKIDSSFPPDLMSKVNTKIISKLNHEKLPELIDELQEWPPEEALLHKLMDEIDTADKETQLHRVTRKMIIDETKQLFKEHLEEWKNMADKEDDKQKKRKISAALKKDEQAAKRLAKESIKHFRKLHMSPPWKIPVSMLTLASDGYSFGSEKGQVKQITDHNQILPLYDYGIGTYDFDMSKVQPMIKLGQAMAQNDVTAFFSEP